MGIYPLLLLNLPHCAMQARMPEPIATGKVQPRRAWAAGRSSYRKDIEACIAGSGADNAAAFAHAVPFLSQCPGDEHADGRRCPPGGARRTKDRGLAGALK